MRKYAPELGTIDARATKELARGADAWVPRLNHVRRDFPNCQEKGDGCGVEQFRPASRELLSLLSGP